MFRPVVSLFVFFACLSLPCFAQSAPSAPATSSAAVDVGPPAQPATEDQIREYMSLVGADTAARDVIMSGLKGMRATSAPYYPAAMWDDMEKAFLHFDFVSVYIPIYQRYMSRDEMQALIDFYRSPAGKKLREVEPLIARDGGAIMKEQATKIATEIASKYAEQIAAAQKKYEGGQNEIHLNPPDNTKK